MSVAGRRPIVSTFSQGNIVPTFIIIAVVVLFYYNGLQVYPHGEIWGALLGIEKIRSNFYLGYPDDNVLTRPVEYAIEDLTRFLFGLDNPLPFHAIVLGLHAANSILVFLILKKVMDSRAGLFGALLFTSFYAHPDVVIFHFGINEALRAFFYLSCIILFYKYRENPSRTNYVLTLGAFILAVGSKETTLLILPPLMYLVDRYYQIESKTKDAKLNKDVYVPFIMISMAWLILLFYFSWALWKEKGAVEAWAGTRYCAIDWRDFPINFYLSTITSFNLCSLKGPGSGTSFLVFSLVLSFLPFFDIGIRRRIILLWVGWLVTIIPLILGGMGLRYLYITTAFSMAIFATCVYYLIVYVTGRLRLKEVYVTALSILVFSVPVTTNFLYVSRHVEYLKDSGRVVESLWKLMLTDFPTGTLGTKLVFINFPRLYEPTPGSGYIGSRHLLWVDFFTMLVSVYGRRNVGARETIYQYTVSELYDGRHPLRDDVQELSPLELEKLAMEKGTKVYLFNPGNDTVLDVTGRDYNILRKLISKS